MYIAGFVLAVKTDKKEDYRKIAADVGTIFREHGATRVIECWGDDVPDGEVTSFARAVKLEPGETVLFSWMEYPDKATYEASVQATMDDPRLQKAPCLEVMDSKRMIWGGFVPIVEL